MVRIFTFVCTLILTSQSFAQLTITEIMYNPPESGTDTLEFVEVTNTSNAAVDLGQFSMTTAFEFQFPSASLPAGASVVVAKSSSAMLAVFGVTAFQWNDPGALINTGENVVIKNAGNVVIDEVNYMKTAPWPTTYPDGNGSSLVLCDPTSDNSNGANWSSALNNTGKIIGGKILRASPGVINTASCSGNVLVNATPNFVFSPKDVTINTGQVVQWKNLGGQHNINGTTATFPTNPESFTNGAPSSSSWVYSYIFNTAGTYQYQCDVHAGGGMKGTVTVVDNSQYPDLSIVDASATNANGVLQKLGEKCTLHGIVYGINIRATGLQFVIIDNANNGIAVFNSTSNFGYTVVEGDDVTIKGTLDQFNGLAQIVVAEITKNSSDNNLVNPDLVTALAEIDESSLLKVINLDYVDVTEWKGDGTSFNVRMTDGATEFLVRIDNDVDLSTLPAPPAPVNVTGLLGQFDSSSPFTEGYQLLPRYAADMESINAVQDINESIKLYPNPASNLIFYDAVEGLLGLSIFNLEGKKMREVRALNGRIDISDLNKGQYVLQFTFKDQTASKMIVKM